MSSSVSRLRLDGTTSSSTGLVWVSDWLPFECSEACSLIIPAKNVNYVTFFQSPFPHYPHLRPPHLSCYPINTPTGLSLEVDLRFIVLCTQLAALQINPFFDANLGISVFWLGVHLAKWTWLGNKSWEIGWFQVWATEYVRWSQNNLFCWKQVSTQRGVGSCLKDSGTSLEGFHWPKLG